MKRVLALTLTIGLGVLVVACQQVFTFSPLAGLQQDPSQMSPQQQVAYAQQALASGNQGAMQSAYNALKGSSDPNTQALAGECALGASGASTQLTQALADISSGTSISSLTVTMSTDQLSLASAGGTLLLNAANQLPSGSIPDAELSSGAAALAAAAAAKAGGFGNLSSLTSGQPGYTELQDAKALANKMQSQPAQLQQLLNGT